MLQITALMDDKTPKDPLLIAEHGLSFFVQYNDLRLLFDCGMTNAAQKNALTLDISLKDLSAVILSHSHYDHAAGYRSLVENGMGSSVLYTGPGFFIPKFAWKENQLKDLSCGFDPEFLQEHRIAHREIEGIRQIHPGVWLISQFPRIHSFETIPQRFVLKTDDRLIPDDFSDEVCMALEVDGGLAVLVGCSHPGILNMLCLIQESLKKPIRAIFGGTHLVEADAQRIETTIDSLQAMGLEIMGLSHCSGDAAQAAMDLRREIQSCHLCAGDTITLV